MALGLRFIVQQSTAKSEDIESDYHNNECNLDHYVM